MKKRNLAIAAFLLCATLVMGIGFASLSGTLNITGTAYFNGIAATSSDILSSLKFSKAEAGDNCVATIATDHSATMDVTFNDTEGTVGDVFTATATYTIEYSSTQATNLPDVIFSIPEPSITSAAGSQGFAISTDWNTTKTLSFGNEITLTVTVTYTNQNPVETNTVSATIAVPLPYVSVDSNA